MKVLCYGVFLKIFVACRAANVPQRLINGSLLKSVNDSYDVTYNDSLATQYVQCSRSLPRDVTDREILKTVNIGNLTMYFRKNIYPLINPEKEKIFLNALKDIISSSDISSNYVGKLGKRKILQEKDASVFLANVFFYTLSIPNKNSAGAAFAATIDGKYLEQFDIPSETHSPPEVAAEMSAPEQMILPLFTNCRCLVCGDSFLKLGDDENYFSTHQSVTIADEATGNTEIMPLCPKCAVHYEHFSPERKQALISEFHKAKKNAMLPMYISHSENSNAQIAAAVKAIYDTSRTSQKPPTYSPSTIEAKIKNEIIIDKIISAVTYHYYTVNDVINNLATANKLTERKLGGIVRGYYDDIGENLGYDGTDTALQEPVFEGIVNEVHSRSHQVSRTVCEWLIAYFIQGCVIFDAISK